MGFFFVFSGSLLKFSLYSFILYRISISILILMFWILYLANYLCFQFFFHYSLVEKKVFILLTLLCLYEIQWNSYQPFFKRDVQCNCARWHNLMGKFDGRNRSEMSLGHISPQHLLTAITLLGGGAGDRGTRARNRCELRLSLHAHWLALSW